MKLSLCLVLALVWVVSFSGCWPPANDGTAVPMRMHALLTCDTDGKTGCVFDPLGADDQARKIVKWVEQANKSFELSGADIRIEFDPTADVTVVNSTILNRLGSGPKDYYDSNACQGYCTVWRKDNTCSQGKSCTARDANGACTAEQTDSELFSDPTCDLLNRAALSAIDQYIAGLRAGGDHRAIVIFRHGPHAVFNTGGGFSFPWLDHDFVAMPAFDVTGVKVRKDAAGNFIWQQNIWLFAHEFGHYIGLRHTHLTSAGNAAGLADALADANGDVSIFDGDQLADTPVDPTAAVFTKSVFPDALPSCDTPETSFSGFTPKKRAYTILTGSDQSFRIVVENGELAISRDFNPDRGNVMSYFNCYPYHTFTFGQLDRMNDVVRNNASRREVVCLGNADVATRPAFCANAATASALTSAPAPKSENPNTAQE